MKCLYSRARQLQKPIQRCLEPRLRPNAQQLQFKWTTLLFFSLRFFALFLFAKRRRKSGVRMCYSINCADDALLNFKQTSLRILRFMCGMGIPRFFSRLLETSFSKGSITGRTRVYFYLDFCKELRGTHPNRLSHI